MTSFKTKRDQAAEAYTWPKWPKKSDHDRPERYGTMMNYEIAYEVCEGFEAGADWAQAAMQADVERLKAEVEERRLATPTMNAVHMALTERDQWREQAEKLADALSQAGGVFSHHAIEITSQALRGFEAWKKDNS